MHVGIVGCGNIAANHVVAFREAGVEVVACADVDAGRAEGSREPPLMRWPCGRRSGPG